jgi:Lrp/AsnC family transcriptional regulator for asnA, asnC and gidA
MSKFRLDEVDHQILDMLIDNTRVPFTDIAKKLLISAGTVHVSENGRCRNNMGHR